MPYYINIVTMNHILKLNERLISVFKTCNRADLDPQDKQSNERVPPTICFQGAWMSGNDLRPRGNTARELRRGTAWTVTEEFRGSDFKSSTG